MSIHTTPPRYKVGIVVNRSFGDRIVKLAKQFHLWVIESPVNLPVIQSIWHEELPDTTESPLAAGVTAFAGLEDESSEEVCARIVPDVDEHHGEYSHDPSWTEIEVFGAAISHSLETIFRELGVTQFEVTDDGFIFKRG